MNRILEGLGVFYHMDNVLVYGANQAEHNARLQAVMKRLEAAGVTQLRSASLGELNFLDT